MKHHLYLQKCGHAPSLASIPLSLVCTLVIGLCACAEAPQPGAAATTALLVTSPTAIGPTAAGATLATGTPAANSTAEPGVTVSPPTQNVGASPASTSQSPLAGLRSELTLADQEMNVAAGSATLAQVQQHAQAAVNSLVGAWGRWYDVGGFDDPSDGRGVFPGERVPGPANDSPTAVSPIGWGIRAYDSGDATTQRAVQMVMGDVGRWRNSPRSQYDLIARAIEAAGAGQPLVGQLNGRAMRVVAWGRLIVTNATSLDQARQYASLGNRDADAALSAVQNLPG